MLTLQLSKEEIALLNYERFSYPCPLIQKRIHCVYLKATLKLTNKLIGEICNLHPHTVSHWIKLYQEKGISSLYVSNYGTNKSELEKHKEEIITHLSNNPVSSLKEARDEIKKLTTIERSITQTRNFLVKNGFTYQKMGHIPAKADVEKQKEWLEKQLNSQIELAKQGKIHLLFMDAAHFVLNPFVCSVWSTKRLFIKAPAGRQRLNVIGAVDAITKKIIFQSNTTTVNANALQDFLNFLKTELSHLPITIVLDNARYQHCKVVKELAQSLGITLLFLPPYSPNLNIIERLWKLVKKKVLYAKYYEKFTDFQAAIIDCLERQDDDFTNEKKTLMTLNFQTFENVSFYPL